MFGVEEHDLSAAVARRVRHLRSYTQRVGQLSFTCTELSKRLRDRHWLYATGEKFTGIFFIYYWPGKRFFAIRGVKNR